jgi:hypothetical protein
VATTEESFDAVREAMTKPKDQKASSNADTVAHIAGYVAENVGGLKEESALQILSEVIRRRRVMYAGTPSSKGGDQQWSSHISVLLKSEQDILYSCEKYVEEHLAGGGDIAGAKNRKADAGGEQTASDDAFSLFD